MCVCVCVYVYLTLLDFVSIRPRASRSGACFPAGGAGRAGDATEKNASLICIYIYRYIYINIYVYIYNTLLVFCLVRHRAAASRSGAGLHGLTYIYRVFTYIYTHMYIYIYMTLFFFVWAGPRAVEQAYTQAARAERETLNEKNASLASRSAGRLGARIRGAAILTGDAGNAVPQRPPHSYGLCPSPKEGPGPRLALGHMDAGPSANGLTTTDTGNTVPQRTHHREWPTRTGDGEAYSQAVGDDDRSAVNGQRAARIIPEGAPILSDRDRIGGTTRRSEIPEGAPIPLHRDTISGSTRRSEIRQKQTIRSPISSQHSEPCRVAPSSCLETHSNLVPLTVPGGEILAGGPPVPAHSGTAQFSYRQRDTALGGHERRVPGGSLLGAGGPPLMAGGPPLGAGGPPMRTGGNSLRAGGASLGARGPSLGAGGPSLGVGGPPLGTGGLGTGGPPMGPGGPPMGTGGPSLGAGGPSLGAGGSSLGVNSRLPRERGGVNPRLNRSGGVLARPASSPSRLMRPSTFEPPIYVEQMRSLSKRRWRPLSAQPTSPLHSHPSTSSNSQVPLVCLCV